MHLEYEGGEPVVRVVPTLEDAREAVRHGEQTLRELAEGRAGKLLSGGDRFIDTTQITI